ncbi:alpha/beta fold hydrolase [Vreelandella utahensis]|uniref:alpha/beta fold hydrolase n=1 Tax=Vreelandella halophila TaxID=86177 RepID=UPI0009860E35|nr:alpha/beta fold hydrolase [Halomonas utahensis]
MEKCALRIITLLLPVLLLGGCSSVQQSIHNAAISYETSAAGLESREMRFDYGELRFLRTPELQADRQTLVLVHGFGANKENWLTLAQHLEGEYNIVAPDLPGHGDSVQNPELDYGIPRQAERLMQLMDRLGIEHAHLAGNSMGGAIVAVAAAEYPGRVTSLSLLNSAGIHEHPAELDRQLAKGENPLVLEAPSDYDDLMAFAMNEPPFIPWPVSSVMAREAYRNRDINQKIFEDLEADREEDFRTTLRRIQAPTLVLWGADDRIIDAANAPLVAEAIPNSRLEILEDIAHMPMIEAPAKTAALMRALISEATGSTEEQARAH